MEGTRFFKDLWTSVLLDEQSKVVEIANPDDKLFFGTLPVKGRTIDKSFPQDMPGSDQAARIIDAIARAKREKRTVYVEYSSLCDGVEVPVSMHVEYGPQGIYLHAMAVDAGDRQRIKDNVAPDIQAFQQTIYENLPIGLEVYDRSGQMIEINSREMELMGIENKEDVLGLSFFDNPNISDEIKARLKAGENMQFTADYDFALAKEYFASSATQVRHFVFAVSVIRDAQGEIDKYLIISQDITERVQFQRQYEELYHETLTILNSLPVGVGIYARDGSILYYNECLDKIFGIDSQQVLPTLNLYKNPGAPDQVKEAFRKNVPIHTLFPYDFETLAKEGYINSAHKKAIQIECNGRPIITPDGRPEKYVFIIEDVTDDVNKEEKLRQSKLKTELAMHDANIMIWELDVHARLFFSENEPLNGYDSEKPIPIKDYVESVHPEDRTIVTEVIRRMLSGEDWSFTFDARIQITGYTDWQYCAVSGSPYERDAKGKVIKFVGSRKNNTELQKKKMLQENILNSIPLPIHIKDIDNNFRYVFCNEESSRMFGSSVDKTIYDVMSEEQVARIEKTDREVFTTGEPYLGLEHIELLDGRSYDTIVRKSIIYDGNKRLLLNVRWDQTLQNDLERRAKLLSLTLETMNAYTWYYEPGKTQISFGDGFDKVGRKASEINTLEKFLMCVHPDDVQLFSDSLSDVVSKGSGIWHVECRFDLNGDGNYHWWETRGMLETTLLDEVPFKYMFGMSIDIDSHKTAELALLKNKEELKDLIQQNELVLNNTNSGLAYITPDYIVQWENISMCSASLSYEAYKKGELCYKSAHNRTSPCENCVMQRAFKSRQTEQIKFTLNNNRTVEIFATPVMGGDNKIDGIVIRVDDITEREVMIAELRQAKAHAEQSDKLKSAFLANMSHEIRTPLNAIVGFSELLMSAPEEEDRDEYIRIINSNNELLLKLINDILDLSKIEAGSVELKFEEFDLSEYFDGMAASMRQRIKNPNVRLIDVNPYAACRVELDKNRVAQILTNYVTNAIKYTPKGFIEMGYECVDAGIRFYVKDSGIGIAPEKKDKVFHRFEKLDEFAQGTGLGLSICKAIAESMGGYVGFESTYNEGSLFWAVLPCDPDVQSGNKSEDRVVTNAGGGEPAAPAPDTVTGTSDRKTILIAEDIASNYLLVSALLKRNFDLLHAENGRQAVEMAREKHVDLVLMDMKMPVMDGLTATEEIRKFNRKLPIVALTAHAFDADRQAALAIGCNDYLVKPIDKVKLMSILRKYCGVPEPGK